MTVQEGVTEWLREWRNGDDLAMERVSALVYRDLCRLAVYYLDGERDGLTLQPTDLVHEAFLHLASIREIDWKARGQFIAVVAQMMRRILIDHARRRNAAKRVRPEEQEEPAFEAGARELDILAVDQALNRMTEQYPRHARVVELRFFGGLEFPEIAQALEVSLTTVERDWRFAKAWLQTEMSQS